MKNFNKFIKKKNKIHTQENQFIQYFSVAMMLALLTTYQQNTIKKNTKSNHRLNNGIR